MYGFGVVFDVVEVFLSWFVEWEVVVVVSFIVGLEWVVLVVVEYEVEVVEWVVVGDVEVGIEWCWVVFGSLVVDEWFVEIFEFCVGEVFIGEEV